jgi:hypothetical protein
MNTYKKNATQSIIEYLILGLAIPILIICGGVARL